MSKQVKFKKHPAAIAWDEYRKIIVKEGQFSIFSLGSDAPGFYLENRISRAFQEGWDACHAHAIKGGYAHA